MEHHGARADDGAIADAHGTENDGMHAGFDAVTPISGKPPPARAFTEGHAVAQDAIRADDGGLVDHDSGPMMREPDRGLWWICSPVRCP